MAITRLGLFGAPFGDLGGDYSGKNSVFGVLITAPMTIFIVAKFTDAAPAADQVLIDARDSSSAAVTLYTDNSNTNKWTLDAGTPIALTEAYDNDPHVFTIQHNADATTKLTVSGVGSVTGDAGSENLDFGSLFMASSAGNQFVGWTRRFLVYDSALSESRVATIQRHLERLL